MKKSKKVKTPSKRRREDKGRYIAMPISCQKKKKKAKQSANSYPILCMVCV